ncbi:rhomboid family intramembrane serine protease [Nocardia sp. 2]|uniref:Rhomboid family intramembrane serine protease n=1 Tax=Nocardia acididurans TaxID=2802282 RepID=A0ABS1M697_9NOCA|nr:rhomboid family intramembrane serine protease [Nocardia acididurans]MBL1076167.1 rhomboid family intramembrane serine protease [Nocardia acididurans]
MHPRIAADLRQLPVTYALIAVNVLVYCVQLVYPPLVDLFATVGRGYLHDGSLYVYDGNSRPGYMPVGIAFGDWYRLLTGSFLHLAPGEGVGATHIASNMLWLWLFGRAIEPITGHVRMLLLYIGSALGGGLMVYWLAPDTPTVGASGAVYGLSAAFVILNLRNRNERVSAGALAGVFIVWLIISAYVTSWQAHLGGFLTGAVIAGIHLAVQPRTRVSGKDFTPPWHPDRI